MTRDELLRRCLDRGVADESTVSAVSHLFYVFLLSALQRGQRVEIPDFGTFGTRVTGTKRSRKIPFFEPDSELSNRCNERHKDLKYIVTGRFEEIPVVEPTDYRGREAPYDPIVEQLGKEVVLDTHHEVSAEEYEAALRKRQGMSSPKEKRPMPKFNLRGEGMEGEPKEPEQGSPSLHESDDRGPGPLLQVLIAILILALLTVALHFFGVIRLWGPDTSEETAMAPPVIVEQPPVDTAAVPVTPTPVPVQKPMPVSRTGDFTVQVSSWQSRMKANEEVARLTNANLDAFVEEGYVDGIQWHRVRVGRYETRGEAAATAERLSQQLENGAWVARVGR